MSSRLGDLLHRRGDLTAEQLKHSLEQQREQGGALATHLVRLGYTTEEKLLSYLEREYRLPVVDPLSLDISREVLGIVPQTLVMKHHLIPTSLVRSTLTLAMADPSNLMAINEVKFLTGYDVKVAVAAPSTISQAIERHYDRNTDYTEVLSQLGNESVELVRNEDDVDLQELERATEEAPVVRLVNALLTDAIRKRASDIHIEPYEKVLRVRFRIDGVLYEIMQPPLRLKNAITSRLKVMAQLDIAERRLPQDGRIKMKLAGNREMDFRVSVLPTIFGEKVVLRLLDKSNLQLDMTRLGFEEEALQDFKAAIPTAWCWSPDRRAAGRPPPCTRRWRSSTRSAPTSRRPRTRWSSTWSASTSCRCTTRSVSTSPARSAPSCDRTRTSSWWARSATSRLPRSA